MNDQQQTHSEKSDPSNDTGEAWKINDKPDDTQSDDDTQGRSEEGYQGEAWKINENTAGDES